MGTDAKKSGNANGFVPGLVLGVIIGAVTAFVALELLDTKSIDVQPGSASSEVTGDRAERPNPDLEEGAPIGADDADRDDGGSETDAPVEDTPSETPADGDG